MSDYISTRDPSQERFSYPDVLLAGMARNNGLFIPTEYPQLDLSTLVDLEYIDLFTRVKSPFIGDSIPADKQWQHANNAFSPDKFPLAKDGNITPLYEIMPDFFIQELSLGPTAAFKDMALQALGQDMQYVLRQLDRRLRMLGATSGDTGSAAEDAVKDLSNIILFMLSPSPAHGSMTKFQSGQMAERSGSNITNISVDGDFDACQEIVKALKDDPEFADLGAVNSINWGRIASQVPYYVSGYLQAVKGDIGRPVDFVVPTGNFGNMLAGHIARKMGVPIRRLIAATNENNIVHKLIQTGVYTRTPGQAIATTSPSMDIKVASNYERLAFELLGKDPERLGKYMSTFGARNTVSFTDFGLAANALLRQGFDSGSSNHAKRLETVKWVYRQSGRVIDPHTADAVGVGLKKNHTSVPMVCMSTALPVKFEPFIAEAIGPDAVPEREERFKGIEDRSEGGFIKAANDPEAIKQIIRERTAT